VNAADAAATTEWLTIREASALVGVSVATLRRWCDAGRVHVFTTPGGHRRFDRADVLELLPAADIPARLDGSEDTTFAIVEGYRRAMRRFPGLPKGLRELPEGDRAELSKALRAAGGREAIDAKSGQARRRDAGRRSSIISCG